MASRLMPFGVNMMQRLVKARYFSLILILLTPWPAARGQDNAGPTFRFIYELSSPAFSEDTSGQVTGLLSAPIIRLMAAVPFKIQLAGDSWARSWASVKAEKNTCMVPLVRTPDRDTQFLWIGPFYRVKYAVYALKNRQLKLGALEGAVAQNLTVGVVANQASDSIAKSVPGLHREAVTATSLNFRKLMAGRVDIIIKREGPTADEIPANSRDLIEKILDLPPQDVDIGCNIASDPAAIQILQSEARRLSQSN
jgi:polar amino acid transport system substrate-binding protein